jgi:glycopeptide antibiotics resistance protein
MPSLDSLLLFMQPFVTNGAIPTTVVVGVLLTLFSGYIARGSGRTRMLTITTLWSLALVVGFTLRLGDAVAPPMTEHPWFFDEILWLDSVVVGANWTLNAVLFVPAGLTLALFLRSPLRATVALSIGSFLIETVQQITLVGISDPSDFVANTAGAAIGAALALVVLGVRRLTRR